MPLSMTFITFYWKPWFQRACSIRQVKRTIKTFQLNLPQLLLKIKSNILNVIPAAPFYPLLEQINIRLKRNALTTLVPAHTNQLLKQIRTITNLFITGTDHLEFMPPSILGFW